MFSNKYNKDAKPKSPVKQQAVLMVVTCVWPLVALAIWCESSWALATLGFWSVAVHLFNIRQSKRLFGLIGSGLTLAEALSGFLIPILVRLVGVPNLLLIAAASFAGALVVQTYILRSLAAQSSPLAEKTEEQKIQTPVDSR